MTDVDPDTLDALAADLRNAVGKDNAITSGELAARHVPDDSEANPKTRELVKDVLMRERNLPIVSCSNGYYIPTNRATIEAELDSLRGRIAGIEERMELLEDNWQAWDRGMTDGGNVDGEMQHRSGGNDALDAPATMPKESETSDRRRWAELSEAERQQVRDDPMLQPSDFKRGGGDE